MGYARRWAGFGLAWLVGCLPALQAHGGEVTASPHVYRAEIAATIDSTQASLTSALESKNYTVVNVLNVRQGLHNRGIASEPILLIEFINLTKAYAVTKSNRAFEVFAPLRAALFEDKGRRTVVMMLRPGFIKATLSGDGLSPEAAAVLDEFDGDLRDILENVAAGGF